MPEIVLRSALHPLSRLAAAVLAAVCGAAPASDRAGAADVEADTTGSDPAASGFAWQPQISLSPMYDSNIYALPSHEIADWVWTLSPTITGESHWSEHRLKFEAGANLGRYAEYDTEDYDDGWVNAEGHYDLAPGSSLFGGIGVSQEHEERGSPDAVAPTDDPAAIPAKPTVYRSLEGDVGLLHRFGGNTLRAGATFERLDYDDEPSVAGPTIDNDDRDRDVLGVAVRLSHRLEGRRELFIQGFLDERRYDQTPDNYGYYRDSTGYRIAVGFKDHLLPSLAAEGYVGYLVRDYDDSRFDRVATPDLAGKLNWRIDAGTYARLALERSVNETTLEGSSSYLYTSLQGSVSHEVDDRTTLSADLGAGLAAYQDVGRDDWIYTAGLAATYMINRVAYVTAGYRLTIGDSSEHYDDAPRFSDPYDYDRHQVFLTVGVLDYP